MYIVFSHSVSIDFYIVSTAVTTICIRVIGTVWSRGWKWDPGVETGRFRGGNGIQGWKRVGLGVEMGSRGGNG